MGCGIVIRNWEYECGIRTPHPLPILQTLLQGCRFHHLDWHRPNIHPIPWFELSQFWQGVLSSLQSQKNLHLPKVNSGIFRGRTQGRWTPFLVEYLQKIYIIRKRLKWTFKSHFKGILGTFFLELYKLWLLAPIFQKFLVPPVGPSQRKLLDLFSLPKTSSHALPSFTNQWD